jgi:hypothetical protein
MKIRSAVLELFHAYRQTNGRSDFNRRSTGMRMGQYYCERIRSSFDSIRRSRTGKWNETHNLGFKEFCSNFLCHSKQMLGLYILQQMSQSLYFNPQQNISLPAIYYLLHFSQRYMHESKR